MKKLLLTVVLCAATFLVVRAQSQRGTVIRAKKPCRK